MPGKLYRKLCRKLAWQMGKTGKQTHQDKFHRNFKDKVLAWKASKCCGNLFNVASVHSTHTNTRTLTQQNKHTHKRAGKLFEKSQAKPMTDATKWKKEEWIFWPGQNRYEIRVQFSTDRGGGRDSERSQREADCWTFVALVAILSARQILILKVCHGIPFVCCVYVMRECVCGDINKSIYVYSLVISIYIYLYINVNLCVP